MGALSRPSRSIVRSAEAEQAVRRRRIDFDPMRSISLRYRDQRSHSRDHDADMPSVAVELLEHDHEMTIEFAHISSVARSASSVKVAMR
jgi:hypothetical protein